VATPFSARALFVARRYAPANADTLCWGDAGKKSRKENEARIQEPLSQMIVCHEQEVCTGKKHG